MSDNILLTGGGVTSVGNGAAGEPVGKYFGKTMSEAVGVKVGDIVAEGVGDSE